MSARYLIRPKADQDLDDQAYYLAHKANAAEDADEHKGTLSQVFPELLEKNYPITRFPDYPIFPRLPGPCGTGALAGVLWVRRKAQASFFPICGISVISGKGLPLLFASANCQLLIANCFFPAEC